MPFINYQDRNILFVHIPKTGGSTIEKWLENYAEIKLLNGSPYLGPNPYGMPEELPCTPQHLMLPELDRYFARDYFDYIFALTRNPYARIASEYKFKLMVHEALNTPSDQTFGEWVATLGEQMAANPWCRDNHLRPQYEFVDERVDMFRFEDLSTIRDEISLKAKLPPPDGELPHIFDGSAFADQIHWTLTEVDIIRELYARDFAQFNYDPDDTPLSAKA